MSNLNPIAKDFVDNYWLNYHKRTIDTLPAHYSDISHEIRDNILKNNWYEVYDHIEFIIKNFALTDGMQERFKECCNNTLEKEFSAYRLVGNNITELTSDIEIEAVEEAIQSPIDVVKTHFSDALEKLSDKQSPDYRNSIKESISAVEGICKLITQNSGTTLGAALNEIESRGLIHLHPDMKEAFKKLYSYTSDTGGIRHALTDPSVSPDFDDAKFMLVSCSTFVNYLTSQANKSGINL